MDPSTHQLLGQSLNLAFAVVTLAGLYALSRKSARQAEALAALRQESADVAMLLSLPEWVVVHQDFYNQEESEHSRDDVCGRVLGLCPPGREGDEGSFFTSPLVRKILCHPDDRRRDGDVVRFSIRPNIDDGPEDLRPRIRCRLATSCVPA